MEGADLELLLQEAVKHTRGSMAPAVDVEAELDEMPESIPADPNVRNYSYTVVDDQVYYRVNSLMNQVKMPAATAERVKAANTTRGPSEIFYPVRRERCAKCTAPNM